MRLITTVLLFLPVCGASAFANDCNKAESRDEKAMCASLMLSAEDKGLNDAYKERLAKTPESEKHHLIRSQAIWLREKQECLGEESCISDVLVERRQLLLGEPQSASGAGEVMQPFFRVLESTNWYLAEGLRFAKTTEVFQRTWNDHVDLQIEAVFGSDGFANFINADAGVVGSDNPSYAHATSSVSYYSGKLFSGSTFIVNYESGAAQRNWTVTNVNMRVHDGELLQFADLFKPGVDLEVLNACVKKMEDGDTFNDEQRRVIAEYFFDMDNWKIYANSAEITLPRNALPGIGLCKLNDRELVKWVRPEFEIWQ